jgi:uncharacterized Zn finger protein (UPF0148 family)
MPIDSIFIIGVTMKKEDKYCSCGSPLVAVEIETGKVLCFDCEKEKKNPQGRAKMFSKAFKELRKKDGINEKA